MTEHDHAHLSHEEDHLNAFRANKDMYFRDERNSPLEHEDRHAFDGLKYFPYNAALAFQLKLEPDESSEQLTLQTSTGGEKTFQRAGNINFQVEGQPAILTVYMSEGGELFLPLRDATSGQETYGAGRYVEPERTHDGEVLIDFNYLYNPYCAYNEQYTCPLPPRENWLTLALRAGELKFHE